VPPGPWGRPTGTVGPGAWAAQGGLGGPGRAGRWKLAGLALRA